MGDRLDHVLLAVRDPNATAAWLMDIFGLEVQPGGTHGDAGTANFYVPIGQNQYIELLTVTNPASRHPMARLLTKHLEGGDRLLTIAIGTDEIDAAAARLGEPVFDNTTTSADGRSIGFRLTGVSGLFGPALLPFFVTTTFGSQWRGAFRPPQHKVEPNGVSRISFCGDESQIRARLADWVIPTAISAGRDGLAAIWLRLDGREVELRL